MEVRIRIDKADKLFALLVKERAGWVCECCHRHYSRENGRGLECSHFYGRRHKATRWHPMNACAHCTRCHFRLGGDPIEFAAWIEGHLGRQDYARLQVLHNTIYRVPAVLKKQITANLQAELDRLLELRAQGRQGRLEFRSPYE